MVKINNSTTNILYIDPAPFIWWAELFSLDILKNITHLNNEFKNPVKIYLAHNFNQEYENKLLKIIEKNNHLDLEIINLPLKINKLKPFNGKNLVKFYQTCLTLYQTIKEKKIDIIYSNKVRSHILTGFLSLVSFSFPRLVWYLHDFTFNKFLFRFLSPRVSLILVNSSAVLNFSSQHLFPFVRKKLKILPNGVDIVSYNFTNFVNSLLPHKNIVIGSIGRIDRWKGYEYLIKSIPLVLDKFPQTIFKIMGAPSEKDPFTIKYWDKLQQLKKDLNLTDQQLKFTGWVENPLKNINNLDIFVHCSIISEPFGRVIIEAMSLKKACIASDLGGPQDIIESEIDWLLVKPRDEKLLAEKIIYLINNPLLREKFGQKAYQKVIEKYDNKIIAQKWLDNILWKY